MKPRAQAPKGVPERYRWRGEIWSFDCMAGTGEPIYARTDNRSVTRHIVLAGWRRD